jgi:RimJ/RimL family protein N-acetyltransferase
MNEDNFVDFKCPYCGDTVSCPADAAHVLQECPHCSESLLMPQDGSAEGRPVPLPITTARLILRPLAMADWRDLLEIHSDEETFRYLEGHPREEEDILRWLEASTYVRLTTPNQQYLLGLQLPETEKLIGNLTLALMDQHRQAAISIVLNKNHQKQGLATEAIEAVVRFLLGDLALHRVCAQCDSRNVAACRMLEKAGLRREGEFVKDTWLHGEWINTVWYAKLKEEDGQQPPLQ